MMSYVYGNLIDENTLDSVASESTKYPKENMYNLCQSHRWWMTGKTGQHATFDFDTDRPDMIIILNHNFHPSVTLTLKADNDPPNWGSPSWSTGITYRKIF